MTRWRVLLGLGLCLGLTSCGGGSSSTSAATASAVPPTSATVSVQEQQCQQAGWRSESMSAAGLQRSILWKAPATAWQRGAIIVMHGGGGQHTNFCAANVPLIEPQVRFTEMAIAQGFAVFLLNSTDVVTDNAGLICGKVWDDEVRIRPNLDLPHIEDVIRRVIPSFRPLGSSKDLYLVGHSSGGYMAVRAGTRLAELVTAIAPVSSGDPYGWLRDCTPRASDRTNVFGVALDRETKRVTSEPQACTSPTYPNEAPWDGTAIARKPPFRLFHHAQDGFNDRSCTDKVGMQLAQRGYPMSPAFTLDGGPRSIDVHYWLDAYNMPLLAWLTEQRHF